MSTRRPANQELSAAKLQRERERREKNYDDTIVAIKFLAIAAFLIWFGFVGCANGEASASATRKIPAADSSRLGTRPVGKIRDEVLPYRRAARSASALSVLPAGASVGQYAAGGMTITVATSPGYVPDASLSQTWANFFAGLPQSGDAGSMTVYFATQAEMESYCSSEASACYDPQHQLMVLTGGATTLDGVPLVEVAAHEFGHHIALRRDNDPWLAYNWGPKYWASYQGVCPGVINDELFPGDEGDNYGLNPAEGWAEAYRVAAGGSASFWGVVDDFFKPDGDAIEAALDDARSPWDGNEYRVLNGRFSSRGARVIRTKLSTPLDGRFYVRVRASRGLDVDIYVYDENDRQLLDRSLKGGRNERLNSIVCGDASQYVYFRRASKRGGKFSASLVYAG